MDKEKNNTTLVKPFLILKYLQKHSDDGHVVSAEELLAYLEEECMIPCERHAIYRIINGLNLAWTISTNESTMSDALTTLENNGGYIVYDSIKKGYYIADDEGMFESAKLLAECVYSSLFVDERNTNKLIEVLSELISEYQLEEITHERYLMDKEKTTNKYTFANISIISDAMKSGKDATGKRHYPEKIKFKYLKYDLNDLSHQVERRNGEYYVVSPFAMFVSDGYYYMIGYSERYQQIRHYRIDRMKGVCLTGEKRDESIHLTKEEINNYLKQEFHMFGGQPSYVTLKFENTLLDTVIDRFGRKRATYSKIDDSYFGVNVKVDISNQFFAWICGFGKKVKIVAPENVVWQFKQYVSEIDSIYKEE